jgi:hypothetical protein
MPSSSRRSRNRRPSSHACTVGDSAGLGFDRRDLDAPDDPALITTPPAGMDDGRSYAQNFFDVILLI